MNKQLKKDMIQWDVINWSHLLDCIDRQAIDFSSKTVLDIGARDGGTSLYFASQGAHVICTDLNGPTKCAYDLHKKYHVDGQIQYDDIDATNIKNSYDGKIDVIFFKSVLGGIGRGNHLENQQKCIENIERILQQKDGKKRWMIFAENMAASPIHQFFRKHFVRWGNDWHYETISEIEDLISHFHIVDKEFFGFAGCFGKTEKLRSLLGYVDNAIFNHILPDSWKYIGIYICEIS